MKKHTKQAPDINVNKAKAKLKRKDYEKFLLALQSELCALQSWVKTTGQRIIIVFEGRDAAGKGGAIKAITERVSPRVFKVVALPAPSDHEKSQMYVQRYLAHFPATGEIVIFDRSWYNRAGVEHVMGFCNEVQHRRFLELCPFFEKNVVDNGIFLFKYWLEVGDEEQERRFRARDQMLAATDTDFAPWHIVTSNDKKRARLNLIAHLLKQIPYEHTPQKKVKLPKRSMKHVYDDEATMVNRRWIPEIY
jgi:polyphosphate kinase